MKDIVQKMTLVNISYDYQYQLLCLHRCSGSSDPVLIAYRYNKNQCLMSWHISFSCRISAKNKFNRFDFNHLCVNPGPASDKAHYQRHTDRHELGIV